MPLKFGTSGVRGLVTEMTDLECYLYTRAFVEYLKTKSPAKAVSIAGDYRSSTPRIINSVGCAVRDSDLDVDNCGFIPTSAVAYHGIRNGRASIMVTGSHIPDDRNGIKFNMPWGEVLKDDEVEISRLYLEMKGKGGDPDMSVDLEEVNDEARKAYIKRYISFFPQDCLEGLKVIVYQHSSVARDLIPEVLSALGAETVLVGRSDKFVAVDTEAVEDPEKLAGWVAEHGVDALVSADGDGDRPLIVDEKGNVIRGDVLGIIVADFLGADCVSAPVSCNTALEKCGKFKSVSRTRIGSPYVIASMMEAAGQGYKTIVGYEANGGFLTASDITSPATGNVLGALPTRDAVLPILAALVAGKRAGSISALVSGLPERFTASGILREFPNEAGKALVERFRSEGSDLAEQFFGQIFGVVESLDFTDGARITFRGGDVVHLRPSGNAPEFRCYTESSSQERAAGNNEKALKILRGLR